ncbi:hypothetical protein D9M68_842720 [compost metagenome]
MAGRQAGWSRDVPDAPVAQGLQVAHGQRHGLLVVAHHAGNAARIVAAVHHHDRHALFKAVRDHRVVALRRGQDQAVHLARQQLVDDKGLARLVAAGIGHDRNIAMPGQGVLDAQYDRREHRAADVRHHHADGA